MGPTDRSDPPRDRWAHWPRTTGNGRATASGPVGPQQRGTGSGPVGPTEPRRTAEITGDDAHPGDATLKVIGYVRVSTSEQATVGVSLAAQADKIRKFADLHELALVGIDEDPGESAKTLDRPGLARALGRLDRGEAAGIVVAKLDRLTRSVVDWNILIGRHFGEGAGRKLFSVSDSIDTRTAAGRLVMNILMSVAQSERETIVERTQDAMRHKRARGERLGTIPFGRQLGPDGRTLIDDPDEQAALALMRSLRGAESGGGLTPFRAIARTLNERGIPSKTRAPWTHTTVTKILRADAGHRGHTTEPTRS
jgi:site-specific DNA recombinase